MVRAPSCAVRADGEYRVKAQRFALSCSPRLQSRASSGIRAAVRARQGTRRCPAAAAAPAEMTAVYIQTASALYSVSGVGYGPTGSITRTVTAAAAPPPAAAGSQDPKAAAVAAATAAMTAKGPASAAQGPVEQAELSEGELALRALLEGSVLCNDLQLSRLRTRPQVRQILTVLTCTQCVYSTFKACCLLK